MITPASLASLSWIMPARTAPPARPRPAVHARDAAATGATPSDPTDQKPPRALPRGSLLDLLV